MKWNATIIVTLFFCPHELTKIVLQKFYKILLHQIALFGLANWTKKVFPVFPRNIPYRARPKAPPFNFFSALRDFFSKIPQRVPLMFCDRMGVEKSQSVPPFQFFRHCEIFSRKWKFLFSIFSCFATEWMLKNIKGSPLSVFRHCETLARQGLALVSPGAPLGPFFWVCNFYENFFSKNFRFSSTVKENTWHLEVFLLFLSLGYGADLGRSRLVYLNTIMQCFWLLTR